MTFGKPSSTKVACFYVDLWKFNVVKRLWVKWIENTFQLHCKRIKQELRVFLWIKCVGKKFRKSPIICNRSIKNWRKFNWPNLLSDVLAAPNSDQNVRKISQWNRNSKKIWTQIRRLIKPTNEAASFSTSKMVLL